MMLRCANHKLGMPPDVLRYFATQRTRLSNGDLEFAMPQSNELLTEKRLDDEVKPSYSLVISCQRNGSIRDDVVDALFPVGHAYHHFQILVGE